MFGLDKKYKNVVHLLLCIEKLRKNKFENTVKKLGIHRSQHMMLMYLERKEIIPSQKEIASDFEISPAAVAVTLKKLEKNGFIIRKSVESDNRYNEIMITDKGKKIIELTKKDFDNLDVDMFNGFTNVELEEFVAYLTRIKNNLINKESE